MFLFELLCLNSDLLDIALFHHFLFSKIFGSIVFQLKYLKPTA